MRCLGRVLLTALLLLVAVGTAAAEPRRVLLLHSFGPHFVPWTFYSGYFREELAKRVPHKIDLYEASLDSARFVSTEDQGPIIAYLESLFVDRKLDLIVTMGAPAARFAQRFRPKFFPSTPLILGGAEERAIDFTAVTANDVVAAGRLDFSKFVENILQLMPDTKHIAWAVGNSPLERFWTEEMRRVTQPFTSRVTFEWFNDLSFEDMLKRVAALPPHSAVFYLDIRVDAVGVPLDQERVLPRLRKVTSAPIFSYVDSYLGQGIVGGPLRSSHQVGIRLATAAARILSGEMPGSIQLSPLGLGTPKYDWRELQHWGISEDRLPAGSEVLFREPTAWQRYRWQIIAISFAFLVTSTMTTLLLVERFGRRRAEARSRKLSLEVIHLNRAAEAGALSASFAHDLAQPLVSIGLNAERASRMIKEQRQEPNKLREVVSEIAHANDLASNIIKRFRTLLKRGSDQDVQRTDIAKVIADAVGILSTEAKHRQVVFLFAGHVGPAFVTADPIHLLQVVLNLCTNAMDAMVNTPISARRVTIHTALVQETEVRVSVEDNGPGIPSQKIAEIFDTFYTTKEHGTGLGLSITRTIVETYGGHTWAENRPDGGAALHFTIPLCERPAKVAGTMLPA